METKNTPKKTPKNPETTKVTAVVVGRWHLDLDHFLMPPFKFSPKLFRGYCCLPEEEEEKALIEMLKRFAERRGLNLPAVFELTEEELREVLTFAVRKGMRLSAVGRRLAERLGLL
ncbi:MAG: hypothetical protein C0167_00135 [Nitrososphaera sp.]|nr:MAG: hypothetical protein C0167_00135 [Nitrososphaera sp.]